MELDAEKVQEALQLCEHFAQDQQQKQELPFLLPSLALENKFEIVHCTSKPRPSRVTRGYTVVTRWLHGAISSNISYIAATGPRNK